MGINVWLENLKDHSQTQFAQQKKLILKKKLCCKDVTLLKVNLSTNFLVEKLVVKDIS